MHLPKLDDPIILCSKFLLVKGTNVNTKTITSLITGAFMRDLRTKEETPLHRGAAYEDEKTIFYYICPQPYLLAYAIIQPTTSL